MAPAEVAGVLGIGVLAVVQQQVTSARQRVARYPLRVELLERDLTRGGDPSAVRIGAPAGAALYLHIATGDDEASLKGARRERVPIVAVAFSDAPLPYVYATDVVRVGPGAPMPVDAIVEAVAARLDEAGAPLAGRLPVLRDAVCARIVASFARKNGIIGAAVFIPGADLPVLALNEVRMLLLLVMPIAFGAV